MNGATTIQERLKDLRLNKGLKLEELAEQTGISKSALGSYEKDDYKEINHAKQFLLPGCECYCNAAPIPFDGYASIPRSRPRQLSSAP